MWLLKYELLGNEIQQWLIALGITIGTSIFLQAFKKVAVRKLTALSERTSFWIDDVAVRVLDRTKGFFFFAIGLYAGSLSLHMPERTRYGLDLIAILAFLIQLGIWLQKATEEGVGVWSATHGKEVPGSTTVASAVRLLGGIVIWGLVLLLVLANLGIKITALVAGLGVGGIAVAFALQSVLGDLFASLSIFLDRPFDIGDFITVDNFMGTVTKIGIRSTRLASLGGEQIILANSDLLKARVRNYKRMEERRVVFSIGVEYSTPYEKLEKIPDMIREIVTGLEGTRFERAHFKEFGDSSLNFEVVYHVLSPEQGRYMDIQQGINLELFRRFEAERLGFAFPTRTMVLQTDKPISVEGLAQLASRGKERSWSGPQGRGADPH